MKESTIKSVANILIIILLAVMICYTSIGIIGSLSGTSEAGYFYTETLDVTCIESREGNAYALFCMPGNLGETAQ